MALDGPESWRCFLCRTHFLLRGVVGAYGLLFVGYLLMVLAPDIFLVLLSTAVRSCGSAVVWVYSTLLLQIRVPNHMLGRMMAVEMASFTVRVPTPIVNKPQLGVVFFVAQLSLCWE